MHYLQYIRNCHNITKDENFTRARWTGLCFISSQNNLDVDTAGCARCLESVSAWKDIHLKLIFTISWIISADNEMKVSLNMNGTIWDNTRSEIPRRLFIRPLPPSSFIVVRLKQNPSHFLKTPHLVSAEAHFFASAGTTVGLVFLFCFCAASTPRFDLLYHRLQSLYAGFVSHFIERCHSML